MNKESDFQMDKITSKTKIILWGIVGEKERIDFDLCDFSPDQVGDLDRLVRADGEAKVRLTIEPEQKKLQIAPITSAVRIVSLSIRTKGQKIKIADFKSPDERATSIKRMCAADTPVNLILEEIEGQLFGGKRATEPTKTAQRARKDDCDEKIPLKFKGLRGCKGLIRTIREQGEWLVGYELQVGNLCKHVFPGGIPRPTRAEALQAAKSELQAWCEEVEPAGNADAKRSMKRRLTSVCEQLDEQLDPLINPAEVEFAEDQELELNADEDQDN